MTWVKIDDDMPHNLKVARATAIAFRVYIGSICYCGQNLTDGMIERPALTLIPHATLKIAKELVSLGLWEARSNGWYVHDYLVHNRSRAQIEADVEQRRQAGRARHKTSDSVSGPLNGSLNEPLQKTAEKSSGPLYRSRDLHSLGSLDPQEHVDFSTGEITERESESSEPLSEPLGKKLPLPPKTTPTEEWLAEMREKHGPHLKDFDETVRFHMNGSWYAKARDKCGFLEGKLKAAVERERPTRLPASPPDMLGQFKHLVNRRTS